MSAMIEDVDVRELRRDLGMGRSRFARWLCVDVRTVTRWEEGNHPPTGTAAHVMVGIRIALNAQTPEGRVKLAASLREHPTFASVFVAAVNRLPQSDSLRESVSRDVGKP